MDVVLRPLGSVLESSGLTTDRGDLTMSELFFTSIDGTLRTLASHLWKVRATAEADCELRNAKAQTLELRARYQVGTVDASELTTEQCKLIRG